jgi:queuine tRNA-ribosyltransferase
MNPFTILAQDPSTKARAGELITPHGKIETPVFMPVGTQATVKTLGSEEVESIGFSIILANTYHLYLRPEREILHRAGGLHSFMSWPRSILTDSGGYQVFSLASRCKMSENGVEFSSHIDGTRHLLTPEITTEFQLGIGSDIAMCLDDCPPYPSLRFDAETSVEKTTRWAERCFDSYQTFLNGREFPSGTPLLFGISQGSSFPDLRQRSMENSHKLISRVWLSEGWGWESHGRLLGKCWSTA